MKIDILERALARDAGPLIAAGLALVAPTGRALFLKRSGAKRYNGGTWCLPGGKCEGGEIPMHAALRETEEETGWTRSGQVGMPRQVCEGRFHDVLYITFRIDVGDEFVPDLSDGEHTEYAWCRLDQPPQPLHPGMPGVLPRIAADEDFRASRDKMAAASRELIEHKVKAQDEKRDPEHRLVLEFNGDFDMAEFLRVLYWLGQAGASRGIDVATDDPELQQQMEDKGYRVRFGWDGDGADKIVSAELDGQNILAMDADWDESKHKRDHGKFSSTGGGSGSKSEGGPDHTEALKFLSSKLSAEDLEHVKELLSGGSEKQTAPEAKPVELNPKEMKRVGKQMGSNPGGVFEDKEGNRFYIKQGKTKDHVRNELTAANLYALAGSPTLDYVPVRGGDQIATKMSKLDKSHAHQLSPDELKKAQEDFATHVWTANWDAAGLEYDNIGTVGGKPTSLDLGGAMEYRGMGSPKGDKFGNSAGEWETMRNPSINPQNAKIFGKMTPEQLRQSAKKVASIPDDKIRAAIKQNGGSDALVAKMIARKNDIAKRAGL